MKKKLLIVVGAGASIEFGMPSVGGIDKLFEQVAAPYFSLVTNPHSNLYAHVRDQINCYYGHNPKAGLRKWANFEEVLYQLNLLVPHFSDPTYTHGANSALQPLTLPDVLHFGRNPSSVDGNMLQQLSSTLIDALVDEFIDRCSQVGMQKAGELSELSGFLDALGEEFDLGIVTLNYDNIFTQARPSLRTGFDRDTGKFAPHSVFNNEQWGFIYHLHGSVHFAMSGTGYDMHGITWRDKPEKDHLVHANGRNGQDSMEGLDFPTSPVVAGYGKTQQILRQPFNTFFGQLSRLTYEADSVLFLGYGFGDLHLNATFSDIRGRRRPITVVDFAQDDEDWVANRNDNWSYQLGKTIPTNTGRMHPEGHSAPWSVDELKQAMKMEVSPDKELPLAIWYNGMLQACRNPDKILTQLV